MTLEDLVVVNDFRFLWLDAVLDTERVENPGKEERPLFVFAGVVCGWHGIAPFLPFISVMGYGADDAIILRDMQRTMIQLVDRQCIVYHIAHQPGTPQKEFAGRHDHWGRGTGFNPENFAANRRYFLERSSSREGT